MKHTCTNCGHEDDINPAAMMGSVKSEKKKTAAQINGAKGGRPRKTKEQHAAMTAAKLAKKGGV